MNSNFINKIFIKLKIKKIQFNFKIKNYLIQKKNKTFITRPYKIIEVSLFKKYLMIIKIKDRLWGCRLMRQFYKPSNFSNSLFWIILWFKVKKMKSFVKFS